MFDHDVMAHTGDAWLRTMTTVQQLADYLDVREKTLRGWLRQEYPAKAPGRGRRWRLTPEMNRRMAARAGAS